MNRRDFFKHSATLIPAVSVLKALSRPPQEGSCILVPSSLEVEHALIRGLQKEYGALHVKDMRTLASDNIHIDEPTLKNITDTLEQLKKRTAQVMGTSDNPIRLAKEVLFFRVDDDALGDKNWMMSSSTKESDNHKYAVMSCNIKAQYLTPFEQKEHGYDQETLAYTLGHELGHHILKMNGWLQFDDLLAPLSPEFKKELADFKAHPLSDAEENDLKNKYTSENERAYARQYKVETKLSQYLYEMQAEKISTLLTGMQVPERDYPTAESSAIALKDQGMDPHPSFTVMLAELRAFSKMLQKGAKLNGLPKHVVQR